MEGPWRMTGAGPAMNAAGHHATTRYNRVFNLLTKTEAWSLYFNNYMQRYEE